MSSTTAIINNAAETAALAAAAALSAELKTLIYSRMAVIEVDLLPKAFDAEAEATAHGAIQAARESIRLQGELAGLAWVLERFPALSSLTGGWVPRLST